jgi:protease II
LDFAPRKVLALFVGLRSANSIWVGESCFICRYGSYGICIDPGFDAKLLPYLDRGMLYAIAHVRGGGEMGRFWSVHNLC